MEATGRGGVGGTGLALLLGVLLGVALGYGVFHGGGGGSPAVGVSTRVGSSGSAATVTLVETVTVYNGGVSSSSSPYSVAGVAEANATGLGDAWRGVGRFLPPREALRRVLAGAPGAPYYPFIMPLRAAPGVTVTAATVAAVATGTVAPEAAAPGYGSTNVQVAGVDEPDIVENNGSFIFVARGGRVEAYRAWPPEELRLAASLDLEGYVYNITGPERLVLVSREGSRIIANVSRSVYVRGLLLGESGLVVLAVDTPGPWWLPGLAPRTWAVGLGPGLEPRWGAAIPGVLVDARLSGDRLVLVSSSWRPVPPILLLGGRSVAYPMVLVSDAPGSIAIAAVNASTGEASMIELSGVGAPVLYMSSDGSVYLALREHGATRILRLEADPAEGVKPVAEATVPGLVRSQWQLSIADGVLAVVVEEPGKEGWSVSVYTFNASTLERLGGLEHVAVRERVHAVRRLGRYLYLVTFRAVDPLFAIDLGDPAKPRVLGYLKAPGFDEYLHPLGNSTLLGVGREERRVRLTLYRLEGAVPRPVARLYLGPVDGWSWSPVLEPGRGHRAFTYAPGLSLAMLPVTIRSKGSSLEGVAVVRVDAGEARLSLETVLEHPGALRATYIDDTIYTIAPGGVPVVKAWSRGDGYRPVSEAPRPLRASVSDIVADPGRYAGRLVEVTGVYLGWEPGHGPPPVTRSDWLLGDPGNPSRALYVAGAPPTLEKGALVRVTGYVRLGGDGRPYIEPLRVELLGEQR